MTLLLLFYTAKHTAMKNFVGIVSGMNSEALNYGCHFRESGDLVSSDFAGLNVLKKADSLHL